MTSRRRFLQAGAVGGASLAFPALRASAETVPGVTDTSIKIGQTMPYSGPASAYGAVGKAEAAVFKKINDQGGINGRKIELISLDDGYSPPKTVEQTRRLVEQEQVAFIFGNIGTPTNTAIRVYLNEKRIPQLFIATGARKWNDPKHFPWTVGFFPNYQTESSIYGQHIAETNPKAKVGILFQNDDFGKDYVIGLKAGLAAKNASITVKEVSHEVTEPSIDSQVVTLQGSDVDTFVIATTPKFAAQAIRKSHDIGWKAERYLTNVSISIGAVMKPAGLEKGIGIISAGWGKNPSDPRWNDFPDYKEWVAFMDKYLPGVPKSDLNHVFGYSSAHLMARVLEQAGASPSRETILKAATTLHDVELPMLLPGIKVNNSPDDYAVIRQLQLQKFTGKSWELFGDVMSG